MGKCLKPLTRCLSGRQHITTTFRYFIRWSRPESDKTLNIAFADDVVLIAENLKHLLEILVDEAGYVEQRPKDKQFWNKVFLGK